MPFLFFNIPALPYGEGLGFVGLPGDSSPRSGFAKDAYLKHWMEPIHEEEAHNEVLRFWSQWQWSTVLLLLHKIEKISLVTASAMTVLGVVGGRSMTICIHYGSYKVSGQKQPDSTPG